MKKGLARLLTLLIILSAGLAAARPGVAAPGGDALVVGSATAMSGNFFADLWGRNTADMDVRALVHGYNLVRWNGERGAYGVDETVVSGVTATQDRSGNRTYTLALYEDLAYCDGTPITAKDYAFSLLLCAAPEMAEIGGAANGADHILGVDEYKSGKRRALAGVRLLGDNQLAITVKAEYLPFFYELALLRVNPYPIQVIAPGCEVADDGAGAYIRNIDAAVEGPVFTADLLRETVLNPETGYLSHPRVTSGPYRLVSYDAQAHAAEFEINEFYKGDSSGRKPRIQRLIYKLASNADSVSRLERGEFGLLNKCVRADVLDAGLKLAAGGGAAMRSYARTGFSFISFSCERPATQSVSVRQAIAHCFDRDGFIDEYVGNYGQRVDGFYGVGQWMYRLVEGAVEPPVEGIDGDAARAEASAEWDALSLENVKVYDFDLEAARRLLVGDGWTLNRDGAEFNPDRDDVRCKEIDGALVPLELKLIYPEGNAVGAYLESALGENLARVGARLEVEAKPFDALLRIYYRQDARDCDMIYLASNFASVFDPSAAFNPEDADGGGDNTTGIADARLYDLAVDLRRTRSGDALGYCRKWVALQEAWSELLPAIPVYSNAYYDFYTPELHNYDAGNSVSWAEAIVGATLGDAEGAGPMG